MTTNPAEAIQAVPHHLEAIYLVVLVMMIAKIAYEIRKGTSLPGDKSASRLKIRLDCIILAFALIFPPCALSEIIPADRRMTWTPGIVVGVPGGIPNRTTIFTNMVTMGADNTGVTNIQPTLLAALQQCPSNQVIYFPAGTYKLSTVQGFAKSGITLRGAGMSNTVIACSGSANMFVGTGDWPSPLDTLDITAGATNGSSIITVSSGTTIVVGRLITISQTNAPTVHYHSVNYGSGPVDDGHDKTRLQSCTFLVTAKSGNDITVSPALPMTFTNAPRVTVWAQYMTKLSGFEDMTLNMTNSTANTALLWTQVYGCWMKNVEVRGASRRQFWLSEAVNCEIRGCTTKDSIGTGPNHEGIDLYQNDCFNLLEDNACVRAGAPMIVLGDYGGGCVGNVIAYNYLEDCRGNSVAPYALCSAHGPHNGLNLFEGNIAQNICSDGYYGSDSATTVFRNAFSGKYDRSVYDDESAVRLCHWTSSYTLVGNVLGTTNYSTVYQSSGSSYQDGVVFYTGYPNVGNRAFTGTSSNPSSDTAYDSNVDASMIRHGNWDHAQNTVSWDGTIADHTLPSSYYLSAKPAWWGAGDPWPSIGSDLTPMAGTNPAKMRWDGIAPTPPPDNPPPPLPGRPRRRVLTFNEHLQPRSEMIEVTNLIAIVSRTNLAETIVLPSDALMSRFVDFNALSGGQNHGFLLWWKE